MATTTKTAEQIVAEQKSPITPEQTAIQSSIQKEMISPTSKVDPNLTQEAYQGGVMNILNQMKEPTSSGATLTSTPARKEDTAAKTAIEQVKSTQPQTQPIGTSQTFDTSGKAFTLSADGKLASYDGGNTWITAPAQLTGADLEARKAMAGFDDLEATRARNLELRKQAIEAETRRVMAGTEAQQKSSRAAAGMQLARMGALGTAASGVSYIQNLEATQRQELNNLAMKSQQLIQEAQMAYDEGNAQLALQKTEAARQARRDFQAADQARIDNLIKAQQLTKLTKDNLDDTLKSYAQANVSPESVPKGWFASLDNGLRESGLNVSDGYSEAIYKGIYQGTKKELAKNEMETAKAQIEIGKVLPPNTEISIPFGGKTYTIKARDIQDTKQIQVQTPQGHELVTTDKQGNIINSVKLGDNYVAPHYDENRGEYVAFNMKTGTMDTILDNGRYGEGVSALKDAPEVVKFFADKYKVNQEPGQSFSHGKVSAWDFEMRSGTDLKLPFNGVVQKVVKNDPIYGNYINVMNPETGYITRLAHLSSFAKPGGEDIAVGTFVGPDTVLGKSGSTGHSTGPHLHLEFRTADDKAIAPGDLAPKYKQSPDNQSDEVKAFENAGYKYEVNSKGEPTVRTTKDFASWKQETAKIDREEKAKSFTNSLAVQKEFRTEKPVATMELLRPRFANLTSALTSAERDFKEGKSISPETIAIVTTFNKLLDENSVVREGEYDRSYTGQPVADRLSGAMTKLQQGGAGIGLKELQDTVKLANELYSNYTKAYNTKISDYLKTAADNNLDISMIVGSSNLVPVKARDAQGNVYEVSPNEPGYAYAATYGVLK